MNISSHFSANGISLVPWEFPNELSMEGYLVDNPDVLMIREFSEPPKVVSFEAKVSKNSGGDGRIDILLSYDSTTFAILELKKGILKHDHLKQLKDYFSSNGPLFGDDLVARTEEKSTDITWLGILVGTGIEEKFLLDVLANKNLGLDDKFTLLVIVLNRYKGGNQSFVSTTVYSTGKVSKPRRKFSIDGEGSYFINRLALALVKKIVLHNPDLNAKELIEIFKNVKPSSWKDLLLDFDNLKSLPEKDQIYFDKEDESVLICGTKYAVLSWWGSEHIDSLTKIAGNFNFKVEEILK